MKSLNTVVLCLVFCCACHAASFDLAHGGRASASVVIGDTASERVRQAAEELASMLGRITGGRFTVEVGDGRRGIAVGVVEDFPLLKLGEQLAVHSPSDREKYVLRSRQEGLLVVGATELAVEDAVWDLLYRLGFRQFFPGAVWEVVPRKANLSLRIDLVSRPDYFARSIWYGYGTWDYNAEPYAQWCRRNRARAGFRLQTGHAYGALIRANREVFAAHPEFYGLLDGWRKSTKLCIGNPALRQLIVRHALQYFAEHPEADSISLEPSDGGGWCECPACARLGSITDRALTLANEVAAAVSTKYPGKYVGMYAYNLHSPPPDIAAHPRVVISIATAFIRGGFTLDELIDGWSAKTRMLGIREYYSVHPWDRDMPGRARAANLTYLAETIPGFHARGARFLSAESGDNWGPHGLGYYVAARMLWDIDESGRIDDLVDDFLSRAFGSAKKPMADFYGLLDASHEWLVFDDSLGRMFRCLAEAQRVTDSADVRARLHQLALYARYVELFHEYSRAKGGRRQTAFERLIRHAYRMRRTMLVHTKALYRDLPARDRNVRVPPECRWNVPEGKNPWKSSEPFTQAEISRIIRDGIARHPLTRPGFEPVEFTRELVPVRSMHLLEVSPGRVPPGRGEQVFYTWVEDAPATIELHVTGGLIAHYRDRGNVRIGIYHLEGGGETLVTGDRSVPPDGKPHTVRLTVTTRGLHRIVINDGHDMTQVDWNRGTPMTILSSRCEPATLGSRWTLYFYVPRGTHIVGLYARGRGEVRDAGGQVRLTLDGQEPGYHALPVRPGQDGHLWQLRNCAGQVRLLTVPPCLARRADELLLPAEVVRAAR